MTNEGYDKLLRQTLIIDGIKLEAKAFHPRAFKSDVFAVSFYPKNKKYLLDKDIAFTQIRAKDNIEAIKKGKEELEYEIEKLIKENIEREISHKKKLVKV